MKKGSWDAWIRSQCNARTMAKQTVAARIGPLGAVYEAGTAVDPAPPACLQSKIADLEGVTPPGQDKS
jgi:hypothetical protein